MTTTSPTVPAVPDLVFTDAERLALASFLAGYRGLTRDAYALDLRQFVAWCDRHGLNLFAVAGPTSSCTPGRSRKLGVLGPPWPAGCAPSRASTATPKRRA
jgi:hypothetical protein